MLRVVNWTTFDHADAVNEPFITSHSRRCEKSESAYAVEIVAFSRVEYFRVSNCPLRS
jgi:hypothetical protein